MARAVNAAADVIHRAQVNGTQTATGLAIALESAQLLQSPETARELERLPARVAELEAAQGTVFRASHDSIVMGLYTTAAVAREHCETEERHSWPAGTNLSFDWIEDEDDGVAELVVVAGQNEESATGYVVEALEVASKYDPEADQ